jgi:hypothetical protein
MNTVQRNVMNLPRQRYPVHRSSGAAIVLSITLLAITGLTLWGLAAWSFAEQYSRTATDLLAQGVSSGQAQTSEGVGGEGSGEKAMSGNPTDMPKAEQSEADDIKSRGAQLPHPPLVKPLQYLFRPNGAFGCMQDNPQARDLSGSMSQSMTMTNAQCRSQCNAGGFVFAGTQNSSQCFCGNTFGQYGLSNACTMGCSGYNGEVCGGPLANSVSLTGVPPSMFTPLLPRPTIPPPPSNGGQCVIDINGQGYRHTEVQRWEAMGTSAQNTMGPGMLIPMNWTITGNGYYEQLPPNADLQIWTISGSHPVHVQLIIPNSSPNDLIFQPFEQPVSITGALQGTQQKWTNGMANPPGYLGNTRQEYPYGTTIVGAAQMNPIMEAVAPVNPFPGYAQPGGSTGTVTCQWHVMR